MEKKRFQDVPLWPGQVDDQLLLLRAKLDQAGPTEKDVLRAGHQGMDNDQESFFSCQRKRNCIGSALNSQGL